MEKLPLLSIPLKETNSVDWNVILRSFVASQYGNWDDYVDSTAEFNQYRVKAIGCNPDKVGIELYWRYYLQLSSLELRVPAGSLSGSNALFKWHDAFNRSSICEQYSISLEKASILFNMAALMTITAADTFQKEDSMTEVKNVIVLLQDAAGIFHFISEHFLHIPTNDMNQKTLSFLSKLILAQAQECFTLNSVNKMKHSMISKLCQQTGNAYKLCYDLLTELLNDSPSKWDSGYNNWYNIINCKYHYYESLASYYEALNNYDSRKFGTAIGFLTESKECLLKIKQVPLGTYSSVHDQSTNLNEIIKQKVFPDMLKEINKLLEEWNNDNDMIYHELIANTLPIIKPLDAVRMTSFEKQEQLKVKSPTNFKELFDKIIPLEVHQYSSMYSEKLADRLRRLEEDLNISDTSVASFLDYLNLPKSLIEIKSNLAINNNSFGFPHNNLFDEFCTSRLKDLIEEVEKYKKTKSSPEVEITKIQSSRNEILGMSSIIESKLQKASEQNDQYKQQYGERWAQESDFEMSAGDIRTQIVSIKSKLIGIESKDDEISTQWEDVKPLYNLLTAFPASKLQIEEFFQLRSQLENKSAQPSLIDLDDNNSSTDTNSENIREALRLISFIEDSLASLNYLKSDSREQLTILKSKVKNDDISNILVLNLDKLGDTTFREGLFNDQISKFEPVDSRIHQSLNKKNELLKLIETSFISLNKSKAVTESLTKNASTMKQKAQAFEKANTFDQVFKSLVANIQQSLEVYNNFKHFIYNLDTQTSQFVYKRQAEADLLKNHLTGDSNQPRFSQPSLNYSNNPVAPAYERPPAQLYSKLDAPSPPPRTSSSVSSQNDILTQKLLSLNISNNSLNSNNVPKIPSNPNISFSSLNAQAPLMPNLPPKSSNQTNSDSIPFYDKPSNYDPDMYYKF